MSVRPFILPNGVTIYVEADEEKLSQALTPPRSSRPSDLPPGAEPTSVRSSMVDAAKLLKDTISGTAQSVYDSLKDLEPDEWSVELNLGFKGEVQIIPVLVKGESEGSITVTATWKKG
ncbi:CU044_2847 family protein [Thiofilum flexile]|uniref:CU044_2847 family protein n=1 Tax=Thiofilum flexile TaxID=125627 RepID=UPI00036B160B|nr:CU044_2847 family protein [Thiofilum flexile]